MSTSKSATKELLSWEEFQAQAYRWKPVPRYDATKETKLPHSWWELDKDKIQTHLKDISSRVTNPTKGVTGIDRELQHVLNTATKLEQVDRSFTTKVALIGAQGAGKSLFINAILDCTGLSLTGAKGFACTSAIVKFAYGPGNKFSAEVKFLNATKREQLIDEHIRSYVDYHNDLNDSDDEDGPRTRSIKQDEIEKKRKKTAEDFFDTMFGCRDEFLSAYSSSPVNTGEFKRLCQLKCREAMETHDLDSEGVATFSKSTPKELLEIVKPFLSNVDGEPCLWPIVDCVTIRLSHPLLQQGLEFIDLPGSGDINMSRAKHADEVKDSVDVEIVLGDTDRIGTNEMVISTARAGVLNHGASKVKVVTTKIDILSDDEQAQATATEFDAVNSLIQRADEDATVAEEENDSNKQILLKRYAQYLQRFKKVQMIRSRIDNINAKLGQELQGPSEKDSVEILHTSTSDYLNWIKAEKIPFDKWPALSPEETGVPGVRRFLYDLPASQNLRDYVHHINNVVPAFVDKLKRVITQSDRDAGFPTIADAFDDLRGRFIKTMVRQLHEQLASYSKSSVGKIMKDSRAYKELLRGLMTKRWLSLKSAAFTRILKGRGMVQQGTSKAKGLENTVNWNAEIALILKPGFVKWHAAHTEHLRVLKIALPLQLDRLYVDTLGLISHSAANLITVEKAKKKWGPYRHRIQSKAMAMMDELMSEQLKLRHRAIIEDDRENNLIAAMTDDIYDDVFASTPELKPTPPGKPKRYVTPILRFRKDRLEKHFLSPDDHFVDRTISFFQDQLDEKMRSLVDKHFAKLNATFDEFSKLMREHGPIDYSINTMGEKQREDIEKEIPYIEELATSLRDMIPLACRKEDGGTGMDDYLDDASEQAQDLEYYIDKVSTAKRPAGDTAGGTLKRVKIEPR
ncbi:hypothetical protein NX059_000229 [Plenodomus lindquistii]|nr:hypothetical protein NX059_000229 [Plenodomus lindquistii]